MDENKKPISALVVDDHTLFRQCFCEMLRSKGFEVAGEGSTVAGILQLCSTTPADILILDLQLSDGNSLSVLPLLADFCPQLPVLIISAFCDLNLVENALSHGARGYLPKDASLEQVEEAIRRIVAGEKVLHGEILTTLLSVYERHSNKKSTKTLKEEELTILRLCSEGKTYEEIARLLFISERTLYRKLTVIFEKLDVSTRIQAVSAALKKGLL